ncbi:MAG TPA: polymer-forming cytoskeletal protein [Gemmatimonadaceae bacterium]
MAIWKETTSPMKEPTISTREIGKDTMVAPSEPVVRSELDYPADIAPSTSKRAVPRDAKESVIAGDITITGKIEGEGHVRLAGKFEGDVHIQGDLTIDPGAKLTGSVRANSVTVGGEVEGNIDSAARVELQATGVLNGDLKAGTLTVASGSRMRGRVEFGWGEEGSAKAPLTLGTRQAS